MTTAFPRQRYFPGMLALIVSLAGVCVAPTQEPGKPKAKALRVLFIGNSQVYFNDLPRTLEALAESAPQDAPHIRADRFVSGGASLERLWNAGTGPKTSRAKIAETKWDYVIVQEIYNVKPESFNKYAPLFHEAIQKNGSRTVLFCTASISSLYPKGFEDLHDMHIAMGKKLHVPSPRPARPGCPTGATSRRRSDAWCCMTPTRLTPARRVRTFMPAPSTRP